jgi:L-lactate dehydrogenase complex protein LldF
MSAEVTNLIETFVAEAGKAGARVYQASSAEDVFTYLIKLSQGNNIKSAVKSKSEIANEIKLRERLEKEGINVVETDLWEWLSQLSGDKTSGKKTIGQVQELISEATGQKLDTEPRELLKAANLFLRQKCIDADLGISEAGAAIAETGTLIVDGNEGVTRLVAVLPRIHVTVLESRNVVPSLEDVFHKIQKANPARNGQVLPAYVTYITGRNTTADIPGAVLARAQGPAEEHVIVVNKPVKGGTE